MKLFLKDEELDNEFLLNYTPVWEGETSTKQKKRIYGIIGKINLRRRLRLQEKNLFYLQDENGNWLISKETKD